MDESEMNDGCRELLVFAGYALAYGQHLYAGHHVQPDTLCQLLLQQQGVKRYVGFESDSVEEGFDAVHQYLWEVELLEGFEMAAIIFDCHSRLPECNVKEDHLGVLLYDAQLTNEYRTVFCTYERMQGEFIPSDVILLGGEWPESGQAMEYPWLYRGVEAFHHDHYTIE